jgi:hypothetical protein
VHSSCVDHTMRTAQQRSQLSIAWFLAIIIVVKRLGMLLYAFSAALNRMIRLGQPIVLHASLLDCSDHCCSGGSCVVAATHA